jgi:thioredoxin 1
MEIMAILDTPIISDDNNLNKLIAQKLPLLLILHNAELDKPLLDALQKEAKKQVGKLLIVRLNLRENPKTASQYQALGLPALVTLENGTEKSRAESIRPKDVREHIAFLSEGEALPEKPKVKTGKPFAVSDSSFREEVLKSNVPVLVDFWADWCGPCHSIAPYVEKLAEEFSGKLKVVKLDVDANPATTRRYGVNAFPTLLLFEAGQVADKTVGANPVGLRQMVQKAVN